MSRIASVICRLCGKPVPVGEVDFDVPDYPELDRFLDPVPVTPAEFLARMDANDALMARYREAMRPTDEFVTRAQEVIEAGCPWREGGDRLTPHEPVRVRAWVEK